MANEILWTLVNCLIRCVAAVLIAAAFRSSTVVRRSAQALLASIIIHGLATVLATCLICHPVAAAWDNDLSGTCGDQVLLYIIIELIGVLLDVLILILPIPTIWWKLQMAWKEKVVLSVLFSIGCL